MLSILPEITLAVVAVFVMVGGAFVRSSTGWITVSVTAIVAAGIVLFRQYGPPFSDPATLTTGPLAIDTLAGTLRWMGLGFGLLFTLMMARRAGWDGDGELLGMLLLMIAGVMLVASAADLITLFVALELVTIPTYILLFLGRSGPRSAEATAKYFYLSILSSGFFLMGLVLIYGLTGSTNLAAIGQSLASLGTEASLVRPALLAMVLIVASLGFKIDGGAVPLLRSRRLPGNDEPQRGAVGGGAKDCRALGAGKADNAARTAVSRVRLAVDDHALDPDNDDW